jgi:hypothetical protein
MIILAYSLADGNSSTFESLEPPEYMNEILFDYIQVLLDFHKMFLSAPFPVNYYPFIQYKISTHCYVF